MEYITKNNVTERVLQSFAHCDSPRLRVVLQKLVKHLHAFAVDAELTRDEWLYGIDFLYRAGQISDASRNEFMGLSDTFGLSTVVELLTSTDDDSTPINLLGPFYVEDVPALEFNADLRGDKAGEPTLVRGRVVDLQSRPVAGAVINMWQTQDDGLYDVQVPGLSEQRFRGLLTTRQDGVFQVRTIKPKGYTAPMDGPIGEMLISTRRNEWRPAHWHFFVKAAGYRPLITELYPSDSPHLDDDVAFGPRESLVVDVVDVRDPEEAQVFDMPCPFHKVEFEIKLAPSEGAGC